VLALGGAMALSHVTGHHRITVHALIIAIVAVTMGLQWSIGGLQDSGFVQAWTILGPLAALLFLSPRAARAWFAVYVALLVATVLAEGTLAPRALPTTAALRLAFFAMNLGVSTAVLFVFAGYFVRAALREREAANRLLLNVLPAPIAERLKQGSGTIADQHEGVSILFADISGSTTLFAGLAPAQVVDWLNEVFSRLDAVVDRHGLEKLRTLGDGYMVGSGLPEQRADHAPALVACALDMLAAVEQMPERNGERLRFRVGINSGLAVAGVIGRSKFHYDVWGDAVNVASRMETTGEAGRIHISQATYELVRERFACEARGAIPVKGKGEMATWWVVGPLGA
jgi:adenylate cyclase